ncbi:MAG: SIMPL domain-containing protein [Proteobacteria bacterium]|nr:SIMPL domain-containing protein [Pseudomonadota bacterium]
MYYEAQRFLAFAGLTILSTLGGTGQIAFSAEIDTVQGITTTGTCLKKVSQDRASVTLTTNILAPSPGTASKEATKEHQKLRDAIIALKLGNTTLETAGYNVFEDKQYESKKLVSKGFRARIGLSVETSEISRIGEAIAVAAKHGVKDVDSLSTFISAEKHKAEYEACLEIAAKNARDKGVKLAKGASVKLGKVLRIEEGARSPSRSNYKSAPMLAMASDGTSSDAPAPSIDARAEDMTVSATVTFLVE